MTMSRDEARILISSLIEWYTEDIAERLGLSMGKETYMDALETLWHGPDGELIGRADAIDAVRKKLQDWVGYAFEDYRRGLYEAQDILEALPSAEAVQGEWIDIDNYYRMATCSHCRKVTMFEKWGEYTKPYDFCPNCGAKMHKGGEDECL